MDLLFQCLGNGAALGVTYALLAISSSFAYGTGRALIFVSAGMYLAGIAISLSVVAALAAAGVKLEAITLAISLITVLVGSILAGGLVYRVVQNVRRRETVAISAGVLIISAALLQFCSRLALLSYLNGSAPQIGLSIAGLIQVNVAIAAMAAAILGAVVIAISLPVYERSSFAAARTAVTENPRMAELLGMDIHRVNFIAMIIASALAGLAGWISSAQPVAFSSSTGLLPAACVGGAMQLSGTFSLRKAVATGLAIGMATAFWAGYVGQEYAAAVLFGVVIFLLVFVSPARVRSLSESL